MLAGKRDKILRTWSNIPENTLIRGVATKGEQVDLCIEYLANRKGVPIEDYQDYFDDIIDKYVFHLLEEKHLSKAEIILKNVRRSAKFIFLQFAFQCPKSDLRELIEEFLKRKDPDGYRNGLDELKFYHEVAEEIRLTPKVLREAEDLGIRRMTLENFLNISEFDRRKIMAALFLANENEKLLHYINKRDLWDCLVKNNDFSGIIKWCVAKLGGETNVYTKWPLENGMYEYAMNALIEPPEILMNLFAREGFFFPQEIVNIPMVLRRICCSESFEKNRELLEKLPIGNYLLGNSNLYPFLLQNIVSRRELQELRETSTKNRVLLDLVLTLKSHDIQTPKGFQQISKAVTQYVIQVGKNFDQVVPVLVQFLLEDETNPQSTKEYLNTFNIPYCTALARRMENKPKMPSPQEFFKRLKNIDLQKIREDAGEAELACFTNARLSKMYSRRYQLNFLHYLKQQRSCYAVLYFFTKHLMAYSQITKTQLFSASETVAELALQNSTDSETVTQCVAFNEMLGFDTQNLRTLIKLSRMLVHNEMLSVNEPLVFGELLVNCEQLCARNLEKFPLDEYHALMRIAECNQFKKWPEIIIGKYCKADEWWKVLVLIQFFDIPLGQVKKIARMFSSREIGENLVRALAHELPSEKTKRRPSISRQKTSGTSAETMTSSISSSNDPHGLYKGSNQIRFLDDEDKPDIFAIVLLSTTSIQEEQFPPEAVRFLEVMRDNSSHSTSVNLMKNAVKYNLPILAVLSVTVSSLNLDWNWLIWLVVSTGFWSKITENLAKNLQQSVWSLIESCIIEGFIQTLAQSFDIFYKDTPISHLTNFLHETNQLRFTDDAVTELRLFLLAWSNNEIQLPLCTTLKRDEVMFQTVRLLMLHLKQNFHSRLHQDKLLSIICKSGISDIFIIVDFCLLRQVFRTIRHIPSITIDFLSLLAKDNQLYANILSELIELKRYDEATKLSSFLGLPICDIIYAKWVSEVDTVTAKDLNFNRYEEELREHSLSPELIVNFYLYTASRLKEPSSKKYMLLKKALDVIKKNRLFPNESFDRDMIEYEMVLCYLEIPEDELDKLDIYYSEYYEEVLLKERCVLYKSFMELKELAGIEDLTTSLKVELTEKMKLRLAVLLNKLLDEGDIVEALRLQALFEYRPIDLHFIVFCMALAEGLTTVFNMSSEERQMLSDIEKSSFAKFNKRTLETLGTSPGTPIKLGELSDSNSTVELLEFEEIPPKEKRETLTAIQGIASKLKFGVNLGKRIVMVYRAAMYLEKEYIDILRTKDTAVLLKRATKEDCLHKLLVVSDIFISTQMTSFEIAEYLAFEIATVIIRPRFYIFGVDQHPRSINHHKNSVLWGFNVDREFHLFLELSPSTTILGNCLLEYCDALKTYRKFQDGKPFETSIVFQKLSEIIRLYGLPTVMPGTTQVLSHKKQNLIYVELLIKAHQCFVHECSMEGIANVLNRAKALNTILTNAKSWSLIVRMLIGIGRYREMFFCFDALIRNEQFESLLGQFDEEKTVSLRQAILTYIREYCPDNKDYLMLAALHFSMYKELAEMWELKGKDIIAKVLSNSLAGDITAGQIKVSSTVTAPIPKLKCSSNLLELLNQALENFTHATENYLMDNKLLLAQKSVSMAELIAMQIDLVTKGLMSGSCVSVLSVQSREDFRELIHSELSVAQAMILSRAYSQEINWSEAILFQFVVLERRTYLEEYQNQMALSDTIIDNVIKGFQLYAQINPTTRRMEENLCTLVDFVQSVSLKYKLASLLSLKSVVMSLLDGDAVCYLKDTNYGRNEVNMPEV